MRKFYFLIPAVLFLSCSKENLPLEQRDNQKKDLNKQLTSDCLDEDKYGNCLDGGESIILPELTIGPPGAGGGTGINDLWLDMLPSMSTFPNEGGGSSVGSNLNNGDEVDQNSPQYLNMQKILNDVLIVAELQEIFIQATHSASAEEGRREAGAYIFYDEATDKIYVGNVKHGENVEGGSSMSGTVRLGNSNVEYNSDENNVIPLSAVLIAAFHTHTPLTYLPNNVLRKAGFSSSDILFANTYKVPIIIIDYIGTKGKDGNFYIKGGHSIDDPSNFFIYYPKQN
ncbi:hypothetical protein QNH98_11970 [Myroides sp. mNGS23_01]|nr:hypothetical protein [Myroides sp. mNGS23_01]WHT37855.1 hypothetical protein QNH98_11970 [Myroides sp. mNGS23_01]